MARKRGLSGAGIQRSRGIGSRCPAAFVIFILLLAFSVFVVGRGLFTASSTDQNVISIGSHGQELKWKVRLALQHLKSILSKEKEQFVCIMARNYQTELCRFCRANHSRVFETDAILARRVSAKIIQYNNITVLSVVQTSSCDFMVFRNLHECYFVLYSYLHTALREKRRETRAADLVKQDHEVTVKLENAAIERSKSVDSAVLGKYSIWRKEYENSDSVIRLMHDQMVMAKLYVSLARMKNKLELAHELQIRLKESQHSLGEATTDSDL